jgi:ribosome-binding protein aMBF1 (putative translation factor)
MARTENALKILEKVTGDDPALKEQIGSARINLKVAQMIHDSRTKAGLSQRQLADLIGSKQPVIARLEDADYEGHSLTMLQRIAEALDQRLELRFVPSTKHGALRSRRSVRRPNRQLQPA